MSSTGATLSGSFSGATGTIQETGIVWGTNSSQLDDPDANKASLGWSYDDTSLGSNASGSISCIIETLKASTTYYYRAFVAEYNSSTSAYEWRYGEKRSFSTSAPEVVFDVDYLSGYGIPLLSVLTPTPRESGSLTDRDDKWYSYTTTNAKQQIAVHTYPHPTSSEETLNYVVLYDESKYAPLWTAHTMNTTYWPDNNVGRNDSWMNDPAVTLTQQSGLDDAGTVGYSKGHLVASNYRQTTVKQNKQTFYHSNQAPQWQNSFNSGVWSSLEEAVQKNAPSGTTMMYVVTGVLYEGTVSNGEVTSSTVPTLSSGSLNVPIPSHFYKCIMKCTFSGTTMTGAQGIAYIYTNEAHSGHYYNSAYVTTIDAVELRAGFDFFAAVPDSLENAAESVATPLW